MKRILTLLSLLGLFSCKTGYKTVSVDEFETVSSDGFTALIDVRTPEEYKEGHLPGASNCNWLGPGFLEQVAASYPKEAPLAVYCRSGKRSSNAAAKLVEAGYTVYNLKGGIVAWTEAGKKLTQYEVETFFTENAQPVRFTLIKHGSLAISYKGLSLQIDPVGAYGKPTDYAAEFPKADYILVTHEHGDHFDKDAIAALTEDGLTTLITNARCAESLGYGEVMANGDRLMLSGSIVLDAVPAYNYTEGHTQFHPKGRDNGFLLTLDGFRVYIAGDTEDIPEMEAIEDIDLAFLPVNQPYTMTVEQCVAAADVIRPKVLIPYHFSQTDVSGLPGMLPGIKVLLRQMQ